MVELSTMSAKFHEKNQQLRRAEKCGFLHASYGSLLQLFFVVTPLPGTA